MDQAKEAVAHGARDTLSQRFFTFPAVSLRRFENYFGPFVETHWKDGRADAEDEGPRLQRALSLR